MDSKIKFYHIPKTGGRFLYANTINIIKHHLVFDSKNPSEYLYFPGHYYPIDLKNIENSISIIRNPVDRTISHYLHIYSNNDEDVNKCKVKLLNELENPTYGLINYQTKIFSYDGQDISVSLDEKNLLTSVTSNDLENAKIKLSKIKFLLKTEYLTDDNIRNLRYDLFSLLNLPLTSKYLDLDATGLKFNNQRSAQLKSVLSDNEISYIEDKMSLDMELYESTVNTYGY